MLFSRKAVSKRHLLMVAVGFSTVLTGCATSPTSKVASSTKVEYYPNCYEPVQHLRAINATADMATHLQVPEGAALLWVSRVAYSADGAAIEFTQTYCRSDYYAFVAELRSTP